MTSLVDRMMGLRKSDTSTQQEDGARESPRSSRSKSPRRTRSKSPKRSTSDGDDALRRTKTTGGAVYRRTKSKESNRSNSNSNGSNNKTLKRSKTTDASGSRSRGGSNSPRRSKSKEKKSLQHLDPQDMITMLEMQATNNQDMAEVWFNKIKTTSTSGYFNDESSSQFMTPQPEAGAAAGGGN